MKKCVNLFVMILLVGMVLALPKNVWATADISQMTKEQKNAIALYNYLITVTTKIEDGLYTEQELDVLRNDLRENLNQEYIDEEAKASVESLIQSINASIHKRSEINIIDGLATDQDRALRIKKGILGFLKAGSGVAFAIRSRNVDDKSLNLLVEGGIDLLAVVIGTDVIPSKANKIQLEKEEKEAFEACYNQLFTYKNQLYQKYDIDGSLCLDQSQVRDFEECISDENLDHKLLLLQKREEQYKGFGAYWLLLAECYFKKENYIECVNAIDSYEQLEIDFLEKNTEFADALPYGLVSVGKTTAGTQYLEKLSHYNILIEENADESDWYPRYIAASTYIAMTGETTDGKPYYQKAYDIIEGNVTELAKTQMKLNQIYVAPVEKAAGKEAKKARKTELPPVYQPLVINLELLTSLADELNKPEEELKHIADAIHIDGNSYICNEMLSRYFCFSDDDSSGNWDEVPVTFNGDELSIPVKYTSDNAVITVEASDGKDIKIFENWEISIVDRGDGKKEDDDSDDDSESMEDETAAEEYVSDYMATYKCKNDEKFKWQPDMTVTVTVTPVPDDVDESYVFSFVTENAKNKLLEKAQFWKDGIVFERVYENTDKEY